ncbi:hydrolase [Bacillus sp. FJAT-27264]|uniref:HAD family hydrolase n=1 Tax=Paenibacillus sp. (strain DSM 101736 / FJAT-27264) TaxID=1850362 RepID=UPI000807B930|nr:HAD family hydrolase [Bacillus sp. FJAT-27264]OBZ18226.1 hydrolase [Bacillus sp. FJAT-27264]
MTKIQGLLFDLDNTLMDRDHTFRSFSTQFVRDFLSHLSPEEMDRVIEDMIIRDNDGYRDKDGFFAELSEILPWKTPVSAAHIRTYYDESYSDHGALMKHALEILEHCQARGYVLGLVTNGKKHIQDGKIDKLNLRSFFKTIVISGEVGISKPDPAIYRLALERLGTVADETLFIGDHPVNDIWGASKAGIGSIWLRRNHTWDDGLEGGPWKTIVELDELKQIL